MESREVVNLKENSPVLPLEYKKAFTELCNELILNNPINIEISKENIPIISRKIQDEFIDLEEENQNTLTSIVYNLTQNLQVVGEGESIILQNEDKKNDSYTARESTYDQVLKNTNSEEDFLKFITATYTTNAPFDSLHEYDGWGFTPKLAKKPVDNSEHEELHSINRNCLGSVIGLGSYLHRRGFDFDMGITSDHPYAVVYLNDATYFADVGGVQKIKGKVEEHGNYKIYRPVEEDNIPQNMIVIHNFDKSVIYEILENMEVLRRLSLGDDMYHLPDTKEAGLKIAEDNKKVLQKVNWKDLQDKLFPEITKSFLENKEEWSKEVEYIKQHRLEQKAQNVFLEIAKGAQQETSFKEQSFKEGQSALLEEFKKYQEQIVDFIRRDVSFNENVPEDIRKYFVFLKNELVNSKEDAGVLELVYQFIEKKIVPTKT